MRTLSLVVAMTLGGCLTDTTEHVTTLDDLPTTYEGWEAITEPATDVGEVRVADAPFFTPSSSYVTDDEVTTWSYWPRRWNGQLGTYGRGTKGSIEVTWLDAIDERTPATGQR